ncbi:hypothetical protein BBK36DRAFT_1143586 [Trichoderma citrinoviride]|uniref:Uncharacterized protein n=1 Tax=Trichoderma citrinoviride TaxID=58853 RepID=A0A2T4B3H1_9HYPO|nr:hypothetical protein BBK36DRAFT_1143586 [Trichoderma citrinoviride]PTB63883.1 hypothetical protein BBK36DRAFT_1143586 [Trichoderma citrinoviride]
MARYSRSIELRATPVGLQVGYLSKGQGGSAVRIAKAWAMRRDEEITWRQAKRRRQDVAASVETAVSYKDEKVSEGNCFACDFVTFPRSSRWPFVPAIGGPLGQLAATLLCVRYMAESPRRLHKGKGIHSSALQPRSTVVCAGSRDRLLVLGLCEKRSWETMEAHDAAHAVKRL